MWEACEGLEDTVFHGHLHKDEKRGENAFLFFLMLFSLHHLKAGFGL